MNTPEQDLAAWVGRSETVLDTIGPTPVVALTATLDHPAALPLYQKLGFQPVAQKKEVVQPMTFEERMASVMRP